MLKLPFKFLGFKGYAKTPKPSPHNERNTKGKLKKLRHWANNTADRPSTPTGRDISAVVAERMESGEHYRNQPTDLLLIGQETATRPPDIHSIDATHTFIPHTQAHENDHLSSIYEDQSRDFSEDGKKPRIQGPISGDSNQLWTSTPSVRRDPFVGESSFTREWDGDHGGTGMEDWVDTGPDYIPKRLTAPERFTSFNVDPRQQEHKAESDNLKKASQQQNNKIYSPIATQADLLEEDENHSTSGRENVGKYDHHERSKAARHHGDQVKNDCEPEIYYYIVPAGLDIIFQDEDGTEITRVGKTIKGTQHHSSHTHTKNIPIVVQDVFGNELFRSDPDQGFLDDPNLEMVDAMAENNFVEHLPSPNHTAWKTIIVDEKGNQIPLKYAERNVRRST